MTNFRKMVHLAHHIASSQGVVISAGAIINHLLAEAENRGVDLHAEYTPKSNEAVAIQRAIKYYQSTRRGA